MLIRVEHRDMAPIRRLVDEVAMIIRDQDHLTLEQLRDMDEALTYIAQFPDTGKAWDGEYEFGIKYEYNNQFGKCMHSLTIKIDWFGLDIFGCGYMEGPYGSDNYVAPNGFRADPEGYLMESFLYPYESAEVPESLLAGILGCGDITGFA